MIGRLVPLSLSQGVAAASALAAVLVILSTPNPSLQVLAIAVAGITCFGTRSLPEAATALFIFLAYLAVDVAPPEVVFSGFATSGFWLLVGGLVIGSAITSSGLGDQIAAMVFARTGNSYARAVWVLSLAGLTLGALVPSAIPRVIVMMPITLSLAKTMGFVPGTRGHTGLLMTAAMMTLVPTYAFLTANLPTIIELGAIESLYGAQISYGAYFVQNAPINALRFVVLLVLLMVFTGGHHVRETRAEEYHQTPFTPAQRRLLLILGGAISLWATDVLHGIPPAWVTLGAAMILLIPHLGVFTAQAMKTEVDLSIAFLIAAVFSISAVMNEVGLGQQIAEIVVPALQMDSGGGMWRLTAITLFSSALSHLTIAPATPVVLAPLTASMTEATGWSTMTVAMAHNVGFSTTFLPHQSPPLLIAMAMARIPVRALTRLCFWSAVITSVLGIPLTALWWRWLGLIG